MQLPGMLHLASCAARSPTRRSPSIDTSAAHRQPGVVAAYHRRRLRDACAGGLPCAWPVTADMTSPLHPPLAVDAGAPTSATPSPSSSPATATRRSTPLEADRRRLRAAAGGRSTWRRRVRGRRPRAHPDIGHEQSLRLGLRPAAGTVAQAVEKAAADVVVSERATCQQRLIPASWSRGASSWSSPSAATHHLLRHADPAHPADRCSR